MSENVLEQAKMPNNDAIVTVYDWVEAFVRALVLVIVLLTFVFRIIGVDGSSMYPTLHDGNTVMVSNLFYTPKTGDIIVIAQPNFTNKPIIKRIIATGGDTIDIDYETSSVIVNGKVLNEPYVKEEMRKRGDANTELPLTLKEGELFVMGDNRNGSTDSRSSLIGIIDSRYVVGRVIVRTLPINKFGRVL